MAKEEEKKKRGHMQECYFSTPEDSHWYAEREKVNVLCAHF